MRSLTIRCFGGFEVRRGEQVLEGFESRKVRSLFAYLACQRERAFTRPHLAGLLWPEKPERDARRNLRQALYNLRTVLGCTKEPAPEQRQAPAEEPVKSSILARKGGVRLAPKLACWVDVEAFEKATAQALGMGSISPHEVASAIRLYRGDLLAGLSMPESSAFEDWLDTERERLRERMMIALRTLIESYMQRSEFRLGIQFAQRLVSMDPLSEDAQRYLIRLFALSGRRRRALDQYRNLQGLLRCELGVEPLEETQRLYQTILAQRSPLPLANEEREPIGPLVPLVGRTRAFGILTREWQALLRGKARMTLISGASGIGKTRLVRSFLDSASGHRPVTILIGRCHDTLPSPYQPLGAALSSALEHQARIDTLPASAGRLARWLPLLAQGKGALALAGSAPYREAESRQQLFDAVGDLIEAWMRPQAPDRGPWVPLVLFCDDLHWAGQETIDLLAYLFVRLADRPLWLVATAGVDVDLRSRFETAAKVHPKPLSCTELALQPLDRSSLREVATWLVGDSQAGALVVLLDAHTAGLPLHLAELINFLWDQDALVATSGGHWRLEAQKAGALEVGDLGRMLGRRLQRLPFSTRRLATLAAVIGQEFEPELIRRTADEHTAVVEVGLELMLERWILRQNVDRWTTSSRQRDIVMWAQGARQGRFDFAHRRTREVIYHAVDEGRRRLIHAQVAEALEALHTAMPEVACEQLAYHYQQAGDRQPARRYSRLAAARARALFAHDVAAHFDALGRKMATEGMTPQRRTRSHPELDSGTFAVP